MRKLKLEIQTSIDGYIAQKDGDTSWMLWNWGPEWAWDEALQAFHTKLILSSDCILLSRQMAEEGFKAHWQSIAENKVSTQYAFAKHVRDTHTIVFTTTLNKTIPIPGGWSNTDIVKKDIVKEINVLKAQKGKDIIVFGGATFVSSLIENNLIDEYYLFVNPTAIGKGKPIFKGSTPLALMDAKKFECGVTVLKYKPLKTKK